MRQCRIRLPHVISIKCTTAKSLAIDLNFELNYSSTQSNAGDPKTSNASLVYVLSPGTAKTSTTTTIGGLLIKIPHQAYFVLQSRKVHKWPGTGMQMALGVLVVLQMTSSTQKQLYCDDLQASKFYLAVPNVLNFDI